MIQHILLATDGSAPAERATDFTASLAMCYGAKVTVLYAYTPVPAFLGEPTYSQALNNTLKEAETLVANEANRMREKLVEDVETSLVEGPAVGAILNAVEIRKPDLVVIGGRGLGTWKGLIMGSVSMAVTQRAMCPVLIVK